MPECSRESHLPLREHDDLSHQPAPGDATAGICEDDVRAIVHDFYDLARRDAQLGPVFERNVADWPAHLAKMHDFWSSAVLRSGRYSGRPIEAHRRVPEIEAAHFGRWMELFDKTVRAHCNDHDAMLFVRMAGRMKQSMMLCLKLDDDRAKAH